MLIATTVSEVTGLVIAVTGFLGAVAACLAAFHTVKLRGEVRPPSNSVTAGQLLEGVAQVQHYAVNLSSGQTDIPAATDVARALSTGQTPPVPTHATERRTNGTPGA